MSRLPKAINWWPNYFYHFTDVNHAVNIIDKGWIYGRAEAEQAHLTKTDAASHNVLNVTSEAVKRCGRLYMRPLTPTQFYNEGYKPEAVRHKDYKDANCPVPVFFLFDAVKTLEYPGVYFVEKGAAGRDIETWRSGPEAYATLNFAKIFHHGNEGYTPDISKYRRTEVLREGGIPLAGLLRRIICRSPAEAQTLLNLMQKRCPREYDTYKHLIISPTVDIRSRMFNMHGIYVRAVKSTPERAMIEFNESRLRYDYNTSRKGPVPIQMKSIIYWKDA